MVYVLVYAVVIGLTSGLLRAWLNKRSPHIPNLRLLWLVPIAYLPQFFAIQWAVTSHQISDELAAIGLVISQAILLIFAWLNRSQPGGWLLTIGLALNLLVIALNGGFMPISPQTASLVVPRVPPEAWPLGERVGTSKDVVLSEASMRLPWLSDRFVFPPWAAHRVALSLGDLFIAAGILWLLWSVGRPGLQEPQSAN